MLRRYLEQTLERLYPPTCVLCGAAGRGGLDLCAGCVADLPRNRHRCARCALPLAPTAAAQALCGACQRQPPPFDLCSAAFRYDEPMPALVGGAKFRSRMDLVRLLGCCLARALREDDVEMPDAIVPVPLHPRRLRERGYNQALEIARVVSRELGVPIDARSCARILSTAPQAGLAQKQRRRNVRGAFQVVRTPAATRIAILDDVVTTGSTVAELAKVLRNAGVGRVQVWAVARTP